jgi:hypothetical protein
MIAEDTKGFISGLSTAEQRICELLAQTISAGLPDAENKIWHRHPVWFLDGNPIVGFSKLKAGIRLMFWSGADFGEASLKPGTGKFKDASVLFTSVDQIEVDDLGRWLEKARDIQWDYKNLIKRKGKLERVSRE